MLICWSEEAIGYCIPERGQIIDGRVDSLGCLYPFRVVKYMILLIVLKKTAWERCHYQSCAWIIDRHPSVISMEMASHDDTGYFQIIFSIRFFYTIEGTERQISRLVS